MQAAHCQAEKKGGVKLQAGGKEQRRQLSPASLSTYNWFYATWWLLKWNIILCSSFNTYVFWWARWMQLKMTPVSGSSLYILGYCKVTVLERLVSFSSARRAETDKHCCSPGHCTSSELCQLWQPGVPPWSCWRSLSEPRIHTLSKGQPSRQTCRCKEIDCSVRKSWRFSLLTHSK